MKSFADPFQQFSSWYEEAAQEGWIRRIFSRLYPPAVIHQPDAMILSTVNSQQIPSSRVVLFKGLVEGGFSFYTNYNSQKGRELEVCPNCSLLFHWNFPERQIRIVGTSIKLNIETSDSYWKSRPRGSQLSAVASAQSEIISSREELQEKIQKLKNQFKGMEIPRPAHWGGFRVVPIKFEFWEGRIDRLHDRILYQKENDIWLQSFLSP